MAKVNWEQKYKALKKILIESLDLAFRQGFEEGFRQAQKEQQDMAAQQGMMGMQQGNMPQQPDIGQLRDLMAQQGVDIPQDEEAYQQMLGASGLGGEEQAQAMELAQQQEEGRKGGIPEKVNELQDLLNKKEKMTVKKARPNMYEFSRALNRRLSHVQQQGVVGQEKLVRNILDKWKREKKDTESYLDTTLKTGKIKLE